MASFVLKRIATSVLALFIIASLSFFLMFLVPGGPFEGEKTTQKTIEIMNAKYGLDKPVIVQYKNYMLNLLKGDLGISIKRQGFTVNEIITEKFAVSAKLGAVAVLFSVIVGVPLGTLAAFRRGRAADKIIMFICTLGIALPGFVVATLLLYTFGMNLQLLPTIGLKSPIHYIMPVLALSLSPVSYITRLMRSNMLDVIDQDYIKTAKAKGLPMRFVLFKHALRNSIIPVITYLGPLTASVITGGFVVEKIFSIPGLGNYFVSSITGRDYPMIMGTTIFLASLIILANLIVDILYSIIDPRIKYN